MNMITASLPSAEQSNDQTMRILERALQAFDGLWKTSWKLYEQMSSPPTDNGIARAAGIYYILAKLILVIIPS